MNFPKVTPQDIEDNIKHVEYVTHVSVSGKVLRWAVITVHNGFAVTGDPSASVSVENDNEKTGQEVALRNAKSKLWQFMGYELSEKLFNTKARNEHPLLGEQ